MGAPQVSWLVVNADDLGVSKGATLGIRRAHREGIVTSASLAVTTPFYGHALDACVRECPELGIGLHFTLTSGSPVSDPRLVPLLVDERGFFRWRFSSLLLALRAGNRALLAQIAIEADAQFAQLRADGIQPDHVNGERHVHLLPGVFELVVATARRYGVHFVRAGHDVGWRYRTWRHTPALVANGGFIKSLLLSRLSARGRSVLTGGMKSPDGVASYLYTGRVADVLPALLAAPPVAGITEVMVHPGLPEENGTLELGNRELERYLGSEDRRSELTACLAAREQAQAWRLTNYRALAQQGPA